MIERGKCSPRSSPKSFKRFSARAGTFRALVSALRTTHDAPLADTRHSIRHRSLKQLPIMVSRTNRTLICLSVFLAVYVWNVSASVVKSEYGPGIGHLSVADIEEQLQVRMLHLPLCGDDRQGTTMSALSNVRAYVRPIGVSPCRSSQRTQSSIQPDNRKLDSSNLRISLPRHASRERPPCNALHLRPAKLPVSTMSAEHRPLITLCHGSFRSWRIAWRHALPPTP